VTGVQTCALPISKPVKEGVSKQEAESIKKQLEEVSGKVKVE
jgi:ribosomal protein L7/L12